jgi:hypothetical protein
MALNEYNQQVKGIFELEGHKKSLFKLGREKEARKGAERRPDPLYNTM